MNLRLPKPLLASFITLAFVTAQAQQPASEPRPILRLKSTIDVSRDNRSNILSVLAFATSRTSHFNPVQNLLLVQRKHSWELLDVITGEVKKTFVDLDGMPFMSPSTQRLLILGKKSAGVLITQSGEQVCQLRLPKNMYDVEWSPNDKSLMFLTRHDGFTAQLLEKEKILAHVFSADDCKQRFTLKINSDSGAATFSPDSTTILTSGFRDEAKLWDAITGQLKAVLPAGERTYVSGSFAMFDPAGKVVVVENYSVGMALWDASTGALRTRFLHYKYPADGYEILGFSPDGKLLALYREQSIKFSKTESSIELRDTQSGEVAVVFGGTNMKGSADQFAWSADGRIVVTAGGNREYNGKIWDVDSRRLRATFPMIAKQSRIPFDYGYQDLDRVSFHPALPLLTVANNKFIRLLDAETGEVLQTLNDVSNPARWTEDGRYLITNRKDSKVIQIWELVGRSDTDRSRG